MRELKNIEPTMADIAKKIYGEKVPTLSLLAVIGIDKRYLESCYPITFDAICSLAHGNFPVDGWDIFWKISRYIPGWEEAEIDFITMSDQEALTLCDGEYCEAQEVAAKYPSAGKFIDLIYTAISETEWKGEPE